MLSIVVIFHNMRREAARTLHSLSTAYQCGANAEQYEVIAIDNGSAAPLDAGAVKSHGSQFRYHFHGTDSVSPAEAVNLGVEMARGEFVAIIVDGARMATPDIVAASLKGLLIGRDPAVCALSWHLGPDVQNKTMLDGYDQQAEDDLLDSIAWPEHGYRLFDISTLAQSSGMGFLGGMPSELSWVALRLDTFNALGGFDERFRTPGGGQVNHEFRNRLMTHPGIQPVILLGEGVFHQFHGGVATNVPMQHHPREAFRAEYIRIVGQAFKPAPTPPVIYLGKMPQSARRFINRD